MHGMRACAPAQQFCDDAPQAVMAMRKPLADDELERFFQSDAGSYPFFDGHSTRHLDEPLAQPPPLQCQQGSRNFHLSDKSIARFIETGHIVVKGLVPADQLADWRRQFWSAIGTSPSCPADWPGEGWQGSVWQQNSRGPCVAPLIPCLGHLPSVCAVAEQLGGATLAEGQRPKLPNRPQEPIDHAVTQWPTAGWGALSSGSVRRLRGEACVIRGAGRGEDVPLVQGVQQRVSRGTANENAMRAVRREAGAAVWSARRG